MKAIVTLPDVHRKLVVSSTNSKRLEMRRNFKAFLPKWRESPCIPVSSEARKLMSGQDVLTERNVEPLLVVHFVCRHFSGIQ